MAKILGILTAVVLAFAAFVATKNKAAYELKISETATQKDLLTRSQARLVTAQGILAALPIERAGVDAEVSKLLDVESAQAKVNADLKVDSETKTAKQAANKAELDAVREKTAKTGDIKELASKMNETNQELERLGQAITSNEASLANLTANNSQTEAEIKAARDKFEKFSKGESLPTLNTRIRSIYPNWGFVTLAAGNLAGVVTNSTLDVVRDGQVIAQLLVTAVESNSASASIVPDSVSQDVTLMVGDSVVPGVKADAKVVTTASN